MSAIPIMTGCDKLIPTKETQNKRKAIDPVPRVKAKPINSYWLSLHGFEVARAAA